MKRTQPLSRDLTRRSERRLKSLIALFCLLFLVLGGRLAQLHLHDNPQLRAFKKKEYAVPIAPKRGNILDTHGDTLAIDVQVESVYAEPRLIVDPQETAAALAKIFKLPLAELSQRIGNPDRKFVWIKRRITAEESQALSELKLPGIGTRPEYKRFYPNDSLAANILGAAGLDAVALEGLELLYDDVIKSSHPPVLVERDARGRSYASYDLAEVEQPKQLVLTLDKTIQYIAEKELKAAVENAKAVGGVAIVLEAKTGAILAIAVAPSFNPNQLIKSDPKDRRNRAITDVFEPGSIFKAFTVAIALETGTVQMNSSFNCENGKMRVGTNIIKDTHPYGTLSLPDIIKHSSNICSYKIAQKVGKDKFIRGLRDLGFGSKSGVAMLGEVAGRLVSAEKVKPIQLGTIGFGQGVAVTPLQIAMAYGAIANGGYLMKPYLIKSILNSEGEPIQNFGPEALRRVMQEGVAKKTTQMLQSVVELGGTGTRAQIEGYPVAGKTGTAQKVVEGRKGYAKNKYIASFVGFAPVRDPQLVVLVSIDEPKGAYYGGAVSAPVFQSIMGQSLAYLRVMPEASASELKLAKTNKLKADKAPAASQSTKAKKAVEEELQEGPGIEDDSASIGSDLVPKFTGLSVREVMRRAQAQKIKVQIEGSGLCSQQEPAAGDELGDETAVKVKCQPI